MKCKFNILLDPLPEEWHGYPIDSDFQTGIQIYWILNDAELNNFEKIFHAGMLLFPAGGPTNTEETAEAVLWFLHGWETDHYRTKKDEVPTLDYQMDQWRIWTAFLQQYHVDLNSQKIHYWAFMAMLNNLQECTLTRVIEIRSKKSDGKMSAKERKYYTEMKAIYEIKGLQGKQKQEFTEDQIAAIDAFDEMRRKSRGK